MNVLLQNLFKCFLVCSSAELHKFNQGLHPPWLGMMMSVGDIRIGCAQCQPLGTVRFLGAAFLLEQPD